MGVHLEQFKKGLKEQYFTQATLIRNTAESFEEIFPDYFSENRLLNPKISYRPVPIDLPEGEIKYLPLFLITNSSISEEASDFKVTLENHSGSESLIIRNSTGLIDNFLVKSVIRSRSGWLIPDSNSLMRFTRLTVGDTPEFKQDLLIQSMCIFFSRRSNNGPFIEQILPVTFPKDRLKIFNAKDGRLPTIHELEQSQEKRVFSFKEHVLELDEADLKILNQLKELERQGSLLDYIGLFEGNITLGIMDMPVTIRKSTGGIQIELDNLALHPLPSSLDRIASSTVKKHYGRLIITLDKAKEIDDISLQVLRHTGQGYKADSTDVSFLKIGDNILRLLTFLKPVVVEKQLSSEEQRQAIIKANEFHPEGELPPIWVNPDKQFKKNPWEKYPGGRKPGRSRRTGSHRRL